MRTSIRFEHAARDLVAFDGLEQRLEVTLAETFIALALDDLEEDRTDDVAGEDLQQHTVRRAGAPSIRMRLRRNSSTISPWPGTRTSTSSK